MDAFKFPPTDLVATNRTVAGHRRFVLAFLATAALGLLGMAAVSLLVDPYGAFGVTLIAADSRTGDSRTARAELLRRYTGETVLIGSSRTRVGYDGSLDCIPGGPACNAGLDGTHLRELRHVVDEATRNPHLKRIVLSLDLHLCAQDWAPNADYQCSRFNPERSDLEHWCDLLWNGRTLEASLRAVRRRLRDDPMQHDSNGFANGAGLKFERASQPARAEAALRQICAMNGMLANLQPEQQTRQQIESMLANCRQHGIELTVVIDPVHALLLEGLRQRGDWQAYQRWKHDVVELATRYGARVWDFTGYSPWTSEPLLNDSATDARWFWEPSHMRRELGDLVLRRIFEDESVSGRFGRQLTPEKMDQHWAQLDLERTAWLSGNRSEVAELAGVLHGESSAAATRMAGEVSSTVIR